MRGKDNRIDKDDVSPGITPAYAGKSCRCSILRGFRWDHPRVCGEKRKPNRNGANRYGSPPRMRGKATEHKHHRAGTGITPAYAGKRKRDEFSGIECRDHPRVCGEKHIANYDDETGKGSPPRMRGKVVLEKLDEIYHRITPAYAGKRNAGRPVCDIHEDHPRVCGEKRSGHVASLGVQGSPPRMRGKGTVHARKAACDGITPAYAGKRRCCLTPAIGARDHPRVCGEKKLSNLDDAQRMGSPPRMRGKGVPNVLVSEKFGITPAYAGKRRYFGDLNGLAGDHPRVCGEKHSCDSVGTLL